MNNTPGIVFYTFKSNLLYQAKMCRKSGLDIELILLLSRLVRTYEVVHTR